MIKKGLAVSPGIAVGTAYCFEDVYVDHASAKIAPEQISDEISRFEAARLKAIDEVRALAQKVRAQVDRNSAAVFEAHESILQDRNLCDLVLTAIQKEHHSAQAGLASAVSHFRGMFEKADDARLRERFDDIRDVVMRLTSHLSPVMRTDAEVLEGNLILVAEEILPSHVVMFGKRSVFAIVTEAGSETSHAAILARSRGIPAVSGVGGILKQVKTGDTIAVDGRNGHVIVRPEPEALAAYRKLEREFFHLKDELAHNHDVAAQTADGTAIHLLANINDIDGARAAKAMGACGIGLFRTEYLYLTHQSVPDENEQLEIYRSVVAAAPNAEVTIRTLDIGGDKTVPFVARHRAEANPFMGWRSIRLSFEHPKFFMTQIRAILRAAAKKRGEGRVKMLFPMVTNLEEIRRLKRFVSRAETQLQREGVQYGKAEFGMMLEVPAAAIMIDQLVREVDFVSVGSNDLVQYMMAADRDNPRVSHLCQPLAPAVLRVMQNVISICNQANVPITVCGEMAGQPAAFLALLGMGLRRFSMSPAFVPTIKELASHVSIEKAESIFHQVQKEKTTERIRRKITDELIQIAPNLELLFSRN